MEDKNTRTQIGANEGRDNQRAAGEARDPNLEGFGYRELCSGYIGKQHKFPDVEICVTQLILTGSTAIGTALQDRILKEQLGRETIYTDEEGVETLMLSVEYWAERSKVSGYTQPGSQRQQGPLRQHNPGAGGNRRGKGGSGKKRNVRPAGAISKTSEFFYYKETSVSAGSAEAVAIRLVGQR